MTDPSWNTEQKWITSSNLKILLNHITPNKMHYKTLYKESAFKRRTWPNRTASKEDVYTG